MPEVKPEEYFEGKVSIREFLVDFFGALMPGVVFLVLFIPAFILPAVLGLQSLICLLKINDDANLTIFFNENNIEMIAKASITFDIVLFVLFLIFGYVFGTLFYRCDPKTPDYKSFLAIVKTFEKDEDLKNWVVQAKDKMNSESIIKKPKEVIETTVDCSQVQFPYNNLKQYLDKRGRQDLADLIEWVPRIAGTGSENIFNKSKKHSKKQKKRASVDNSETLRHSRSKIFINALKIRLQFHFPEHCSTIIKNEAHVRLSSSMWYVSKSLMRFSIYGLLISVVAGCFVVFNLNYILHQNLLDFIITLSLCSATFMIAWRIKAGIEKFFHYQRVREIFYVLETALAASKTKSNGYEMLFEGI